MNSSNVECDNLASYIKEKIGSCISNHEIRQWDNSPEKFKFSLYIQILKRFIKVLYDEDNVTFKECECIFIEPVYPIIDKNKNMIVIICVPMIVQFILKYCNKNEPLLEIEEESNYIKNIQPVNKLKLNSSKKRKNICPDDYMDSYHVSDYFGNILIILFIIATHGVYHMIEYRNTGTISLTEHFKRKYAEQNSLHFWEDFIFKEPRPEFDSLLEERNINKKIKFKINYGVYENDEKKISKINKK